ncbi:hypothetical protein T492DRAFT_906509 [Pavlovales sp. CCMP2436]|nr:hypothetical protein T492DRAFT_906509 [Pavlovales sp. CCMP2436]
MPVKYESRLSWLDIAEELHCGAWPSGALQEKVEQMGVDTEEMAWRCATYRTKHAMPTRGLDQPIARDACALWCNATHDPSAAVDGERCCQWLPSSSAPVCMWADGSARFIQQPRGCAMDGGKTCIKTNAYQECSLATAFEPAMACKYDKRRVIGVYSMPTLNACSQLCSSPSLAPGCVAFGFDANPSDSGKPDPAGGIGWRPSWASSLYKYNYTSPGLKSCNRTRMARVGTGGSVEACRPRQRLEEGKSRHEDNSSPALEELVFGDGQGRISPPPAESSVRAPAPWHRASIETLDVSQCCLLRP